MDSANSSHTGVQIQLDRLAALSPGADVLGLDRINALLARLGDPQRSLPPVFHVAGTNGKGSTCAFLRAAIEAAGLSAHVYTSPHLVRFNERIRLAGKLIEDGELAALLLETLDAAQGMEISFFEATTAAAFLAFARTPADACIVEVGLGGRLDATNVIPAPLVCGIAQLGLDHAQFLGKRLEQVAGEKAGIAKPGAPLVTQPYPKRLARRIEEATSEAGALWLPRGTAWDARVASGRIRYRDARGTLDLPTPRLTGRHQAMNAALAVAMLRHQERLAVSEAALETSMGTARWPARLQKLGPGPLRDLLPPDVDLWLDGAHNPAAARSLAAYFDAALGGPRLAIVAGLLANKDAAGVLGPLARVAASLTAVPVPGHDHHEPEALARAARKLGLRADSASDVGAALKSIAARRDGEAPPVLIMGSLYLTGEVLAANGEAPD